jgi:hypothetical protein
LLSNHGDTRAAVAAVRDALVLDPGNPAFLTALNELMMVPSRGT